ncbi:AP2/ERF and B3 domain-containing transcription factor At1g51120 [Linum grandiflorum]
MKCWRFRYCYWRSSQSFVFTRGWNRFVKDKKLKEKDIVTFYRCIVAEHQFFFIDVTRQRSSTNGGQELLQEEHGFNWRVPHMIQKEETILGSSKSISNIDVPGKGVRLFGVELI